MSQHFSLTEIQCLGSLLFGRYPKKANPADDHIIAHEAVQFVTEAVPTNAQLAHLYGLYGPQNVVIVPAGRISKEDFYRKPPMTLDEIIEKYRDRNI